LGKKCKINFIFVNSVIVANISQMLDDY